MTERWRIRLHPNEFFGLKPARLTHRQPSSENIVANRAIFDMGTDDHSDTSLGLERRTKGLKPRNGPTRVISLSNATVVLCTLFGIRW